MQQGRYPQSTAQPPPMYPGHTVSQMPRPPGGYAMQQRVITQEMLARMSPQQRAYYIQRQQRIRQQQQQQQQQQQRALAAMAVARRPMMGQFNPQYQPMRPLQAAPAVPMQQVEKTIIACFYSGIKTFPCLCLQVMQQSGYPQQQHMMMRVPHQPTMQFTQQGRMNPMHRQLY